MVSIQNISHLFGELQVLDQINFQIQEDEIVGVIGPSGCGKSTLMNIVAGLLTPSQGQIQMPLTKQGATLSSKKAFIFQDDRLLPWLSVWDNIRIVREENNPKAIQKLIDEVGLSGFEHYKPDQLSGGMKKRCGIARAFYYQGKLLLMDEPFQGLDYILKQDMLTMLMRLWRENRQGVLFISHDIDELLSVACRIFVLSSRPGTIQREYVLPLYQDRKINKEDLHDIRQEILSCIIK